MREESTGYKIGICFLILAFLDNSRQKPLRVCFCGELSLPNCTVNFYISYDLIGSGNTWHCSVFQPLKEIFSFFNNVQGSISYGLSLRFLVDLIIQDISKTMKNVSKVWSIKTKVF